MKKTLETIDCNTPGDLIVAIMQLFNAAGISAGRIMHPDDFAFANSEPIRVALIEETLTDGSTVYNFEMGQATPERYTSVTRNGE